MSNYHIPVMLNEVIELLSVQENSWYIDCNLGGGGHTDEILKRGGKILGIDLDVEAIEEVAHKHKLQVFEKDGAKTAVSDRLILVQSNFANLAEVVRKYQVSPIKGILFDLGVSSHQLETPDRGFSFNQGGELDMRMDQTGGAKAQDLINGLHEKELAELFWKLGEERFSRQIAKKIVEVRKNKLITTTDELADIITRVRHRSPSDRTHPATRVFQALRIAVNDELNALTIALPQAFNILAKDGRLVVISFHSLEDRIVKNYFHELENSKQAEDLTEKPITPTETEIVENPRSRSGKLRGIAKL